MMMRPASSSARISRSDRIIGAMLPGVGDLDPAGQRLRGLAVVDRARGGGHAFIQAFGEACDPERRTGVEDHDIAAGPLLTVEDPAGDGGVVRSVATAELVGRDLPEPELRRIEMRLTHGAVFDVVDG